ncbi:MAG: UDP-N-acetylglucosamine 2-epimerase (non-hydrolyzing) [Bacteroidetes bacterium]|nr:MAG: UDP-N-acetylglucosamine 2-epimerase (non-hydrolyzing) [Bacteroidota bacterium]
MKLLTIVGARPQFVKAAALSREIKKHPQLHEIIVHTGQHFDANMSDVFFEEMDIPKPDYHLNINGLSHGAMTGQMLEELEKVMMTEKPDVVLVYGDTNSTIAGALAAKKLHIKVAHVEAGLRSFNMQMPEEVNRILTDRISDWLFCPTDTAILNLKKEGYDHLNTTIIKTGDVMEDAALFYAEKAATKSTLLQELNLNQQPFILATIHRAENTDHPENLKNIIEALNELNKTVAVVLPLHPRTKKIIAQQQLQTNFTIIDPVGYFDMIALLQNCSLVITDSGGLQKEAFFFRKFCITTREQTEWVELVQEGYNVIVGTNKANIITQANRYLQQPYPEAKNLYGNGHACANICNALLNT